MRSSPRAAPPPTPAELNAFYLASVMLRVPTLGQPKQQDEENRQQAIDEAWTMLQLVKTYTPPVTGKE